MRQRVDLSVRVRKRRASVRAADQNPALAGVVAGVKVEPQTEAAFRDAELCADALDDSLSGTRAFDVAMDEYQSTRDEHVLPMFEFTCQLATLEPPPPEMQQLLGAVHGNQDAMDGFARVNAGVTSPAEFLSDENVRRIFAAAG
jgi:hypothetical protein